MSLIPNPSSGMVQLHEAMSQHFEATSGKADSSLPKKNVLVVGAGQQGITTAYWLGRAGHKVTVVEKCSGSSSPSSLSSPISGAASSYTGLLQVNSSFAPLMARPNLLRAYKVQWCPSSNYMHPVLRVGLFDHDVGRSIRLALAQFTARQGFIESVNKLNGMAMWNNWLVGKLINEWSTSNNDATNKPSKGWLSSSSSSASPSSSAAITPIVRSSTLLAYDGRSWADLKDELTTQLYLNDSKAPEPQALKLPPPMVTSEAAPLQFRQIDDLQLVEKIPSLKPKEFQLAGGIVFTDEVAVDNIAILNKMKNESVEKFGVKFMYDTEVLKFQTQSNSFSSPTAATSTAVVPSQSSSSSSSSPASTVTSVLTSNGPMSSDVFVLCAGGDSKRIMRESQLPGVKPILTYTTKTHHLAFPNPSPNDSQLISPTSVLLPETHTTITTFPHQIRVSSGTEINSNEDLSIEPIQAGTKLVTPAPKLDPPRLKQLVEDVSGVYPTLTREVISQQGATIPNVSLRTWTIDNKPLMGQYSPAVRNLFINNAHGNLGWSFAVAAGKHTTDLITGTPTFIDPTPFAPNRFAN